MQARRGRLPVPPRFFALDRHALPRPGSARPYVAGVRGATWGFVLQVFNEFLDLALQFELAWRPEIAAQSGLADAPDGLIAPLLDGLPVHAHARRNLVDTGFAAEYLYHSLLAVRERATDRTATGGAAGSFAGRG
jgi:hypothetical protein